MKLYNDEKVLIYYMSKNLAIILICSTLIISACGLTPTGGVGQAGTSTDKRQREQIGTLTGGKKSQHESSGFEFGDLFNLGTNDDKPQYVDDSNVNNDLWHATLETLSFMPLASVDKKSGVIISDWYQSPHVNDERFKINAYITDKQLNANSLNLKIFKQAKVRNGWRAAKTSPDLENKFIDNIISKARENVAHKISQNRAEDN
jgi:hypothetical protein